MQKNNKNYSSVTTKTTVSNLKADDDKTEQRGLKIIDFSPSQFGDKLPTAAEYKIYIKNTTHPCINSEWLW